MYGTQSNNYRDEVKSRKLETVNLRVHHVVEKKRACEILASLVKKKADREQGKSFSFIKNESDMIIAAIMHCWKT